MDAIKKINKNVEDLASEIANTFNQLNLGNITPGFEVDGCSPGTAVNILDKNLDYLKKPGFYRQPNLEFATSSNNFPENNIGIIIVFDIFKENYIPTSCNPCPPSCNSSVIQIFITSDADIYIRSQKGKDGLGNLLPWNRWKLLFNNELILPLQNKLNELELKVNSLEI